MKKHALVLAALFCAVSAQAQTQHTAPAYVTVAGGVSHLNIDCAGTTACDSNGSGLKVVGGYSFGNGFSIEAGYIGFGKFKAAVGTTGLTAKPTAVLVGGAFAVPMSTDWGFNARLGVAQVKTKIDAFVGSATGSDSESKAKVYAGVGVTYALNNSVKLELAVDSTNVEYAGEKGAVRLISLGATFAF
jgi:OOP family OmpA-OmpF porin